MSAGELYVELLQYDELGKRFTTIIGLVVLQEGELGSEIRSIADLRRRILSELSEELDFDFVFVKNLETVPISQESERGPMTVVRMEDENKKTYKEYKVTITRDPRSRRNNNGTTNGGGGSHYNRANVMSFDARSAHSGASRSQLSAASDVKDSGFMQKLDIFAGAFQRYYFQIDTTCTLYCFGPCHEGQFEYEFRDLPRTEAAESFSLKDLVKIIPYEGQIEKPRFHFAMELRSGSGARWVLAVPSVAEFAKWIKSFHKASRKLEAVQYNIVNEKYAWTSAPKTKSKDNSDARSNGGSSKTGRNRPGPGSTSGSAAGGGGSRYQGSTNESSVTRIKTFKVITFTDTHFGMQLTSSGDGTVVHTVSKEGTAYKKGVNRGDLIVSVNDKNVVGMKWRDVKQEILRASRPVRITFGKPSSKNLPPTPSKPGSVSSGLALRRRLGPYLYGAKKKPQESSARTMQQKTIPPQSAVKSLNPKHGYLSPQVGSQYGSPKPTPIAPPRSPYIQNKFRSTLFGTFNNNKKTARARTRRNMEDEDNPKIAARAASRQLSRYRGLTSKLYQAIEESYEREEQVERMLKAVLAEARKAGSMELTAGGAAPSVPQGAFSSRFVLGSKNAEHQVVEELHMTMQRKGPNQPPVPVPMPFPTTDLPGGGKLKQPRTRSIRDEVAISSRLNTTKVNPNRVARLQGVFKRAQDNIPPPVMAASVSCFDCFRSVVLKKLNRRREQVIALLALAKEGSVEDKEDALDAILDIASTSNNLKMLIEAGIIPVLIDSLKSDDSIVIKENAAGILWNLSDDPRIARLIIRAGAVPLLLNLLSAEADDENSSDIAKEESAGALWNLADTIEAKEEILRHNGAEIVVRVLIDMKETTEFTKENLAGVIWNLSYDIDCLHALMKHDPISALSRLIVKGTVVAQENAAGAIMRISLARQYREMIKNAPDAIPALVQLLAFGSALSRENACGALHNIAMNDDKIQRLIAEEGAIPPLVRLLHNEFPVSMRSRAALCLRTLSQNQDNKVEISKAGGVDLLVKALKEDDALLQIHIVEAIWGLAHEDEQNKVLIAQSGAIPKLVSVLRNGSSSEAKVRAAGALGALAENKNNSNAIVRSGAIETLVEMVKHGDRASKREAATALGNLSMGSPMAQKKVMKTLQGGAAIGLKGGDRDNIQSIRAKLVELEQLEDEDFFEFFSSQYLDSRADTEQDDEDDHGSYFSKNSKKAF